MLRKYNNSRKSFRRSQKKKPLDAKKKRKVLEMKGGRSFSNMYKILVEIIFFSQREKEKNSIFVTDLGAWLTCIESGPGVRFALEFLLRVDKFQFASRF